MFLATRMFGIFTAFLLLVTSANSQFARTQDFSNSDAPSDIVLVQAADGWQPLVAEYGQGTAICNENDDRFVCFAIRCGKGRGLEFAVINFDDNHSEAPVAEISVDGLPSTPIAFTLTEGSDELHAPYLPDQHGELIRQLHAGRSMTLDIGKAHLFSLRGSSREIARTFKTCGSGEPGRPAVSAERKSRSADSELREHVKRVSQDYRRAMTSTPKVDPADAQKVLEEAIAIAESSPDEARRLFRTAIASTDPSQWGQVGLSFFSDPVIKTLARLEMNAEVEYLAGLRAVDSVDFYRQDKSNLSFTTMRIFGLELESLKLYDLADKYYTEIEQSDGPATGYMLGFAGGMADTGRFEVGRNLAERALKYAKETANHSDQAKAHILLAKIANATGDIETGGEHARTALKLIGQHRVQLFPFERKELDRLLSDALVIAGDSGSALDDFERVLEKSFSEYCGVANGGYFEPVDLSIFDGDIALARSASKLPVVAKLPDCHRQKLNAIKKGAIYAPDYNPLREIMFFFGVAGDMDGAIAFLQAALDPDVYGREQDLAQAAGQAFDGLFLAGRGVWMIDLAGVLAGHFDRRRLQFVADSVFADGYLSMALMFLELGHQDAALRVAEAVITANENYTKEYPKTLGDDEPCRTPYACAFLATMADRNLISADTGQYLAHLPEQFRLNFSGAGTVDEEVRFLYLTAIDTAGYFADRNSLLVAGTYLDIANEWATSDVRTEDALSTMDALNILTLSARVEAAKGNRQLANDIAGQILQSIRAKIDTGATFGPDVLLRWSTKLKRAVDIYLATLPFEEGGVVAVDDDILTAVGIGQASGTVSTFIKLSARMGLESGELARNHQDLGVELDRSYAKLAGLDGGEAKAVIARISALERERNALAARLREEAPGYFSAARLHFPSLSQLRRYLQPDETMIATYTSGQNAYVLRISDEAAQIRKLAETPQALGNSIERLRDAMDANRGYRPVPLTLAHELFQILFGPSGLEGVARIVFVPHGPFDGLSLPALVVTEPEQEDLDPSDLRKIDVDWLVRKASLSVLPSIGAISMLRRTSLDETRRYFGIGNPDYSNPVTPGSPRGSSGQEISFTDLPETEDEIRTIAALFGADEEKDLLLGSSASEERLKSADLSSYDVISFAAHGVFAGEVDGFDEPALILSIPEQPSGTNDGLLKASEVAQLKLNAEIVILSACNTAAASGKPGAEGLSGLARSFFFAGARNLAVTHWNVPSQATVSLVTGMAKRKQSNPAMRWSEALRLSQIELIDTDGPAQFAHPASWAAFFVVGGENLEPLVELASVPENEGSNVKPEERELAAVETESDANRNVEQETPVRMERDARELVQRLNQALSGPAGSVLGQLDSLYANEVQFYGTTFSLTEITEDKRKLITRWPERSYRAPDDEIEVRCDRARQTCDVESTVYWNVFSSGRNQRAHGIQRTFLELDFSDGVPKVVRENAENLSN